MKNSDDRWRTAKTPNPQVNHIAETVDALWRAEHVKLRFTNTETPPHEWN